MDWQVLSFLAEPWFVLPWYAVGIAGAAWVSYDVNTANTPLKKAMKWAWPIIVLFFSVIGLALYVTTARAPNIGALDQEEKQRAHDAYERSMLRRTNGAVIHCVAGDGIGIMTGMVIARALGMTFWQEFWFEYAVGFAFGWLIFQLRSMMMMTDSIPKALAMAFRAEFFSMLTVMAGMGATMTFITPSVVGAQPKPLTYAFWGFGMLGLLVGYVLTFPMNWMMVKVGWKHGMGSKEGAAELEGEGAKAAFVAAMVVVGVAALVLPGWLTEVREHRPPAVSAAAAVSPRAAQPPEAKLEVLARGIRESVAAASRDLSDHRAAAADALDGAKRAAEVGAHAAPGSVLPGVLHEVDQARHALWMGSESGARRHLAAATTRLEDFTPPAASEAGPRQDYAGVPIVDARGYMIGEIVEMDGGRVRVAVGGVRDFWGFWDIGARRESSLPADALVFGPRTTIGKSYAMLPALTRTPVAETPRPARRG